MMKREGLAWLGALLLVALFGCGLMGYLQAGQMSGYHFEGGQGIVDPEIQRELEEQYQYTKASRLASLERMRQEEMAAFGKVIDPATIPKGGVQ